MIRACCKAKKPGSLDEIACLRQEHRLRVVGLDVRAGYEFQSADEFTVHIRDRNEIFSIAEDEIFFAVMKSGDVFQDEAIDFPQNGFQGARAVKGSTPHEPRGRAR